MMIFKKVIPRRTFLRGAGATLALPLLDGMVPAFAGALDATAKPAVRLSIVFVPNGRIMDHWTPQGTPQAEGSHFELPSTLKPLAPFQDRLLVLSELASKPNEQLLRSSIGVDAGPHATASGIFLTGVYPQPNGQAGISMDQIAAKELGKHTQLASLELSLESGETGGGGDGADSDAYLNTMSWRSATTPLPVENNPRRVFERLFGESDSTDPAERLRRMQQDRSILDIVTGQVSRLAAGLGSGDRAKLTEYLEAIRDVERRIHMAEKTGSRELPLMERPAGMPADYEEHARLMFDLQVLAYQSDMTRVITFAMAREKSERAYREIGLEEGHHALTHHGYNAAMMAKCIRIETYQSRQFAYFLEKMRSTPDGDGSLLDHSVILFASSISDGHTHFRGNLPVVLAGGAAGRIKGGRHIRYAKDTPLANLFMTILDMTGVRVENFGDSTGKLELLSVG
ncbi:MAG: DUF1552 domain-containing protein [Acidobacteria bacterium]|nr:DUF1552 domain-containing protein [Acidobacteriota bacterium]MCZ6752070.1 DUF1552 domain-containing protein [Acidobacteriota bacterium]